MISSEDLLSDEQNITETISTINNKAIHSIIMKTWYATWKFKECVYVMQQYVFNNNDDMECFICVQSLS